jgi:pimeloyl-ACP methyl ester carboxylesterase
MAILQIDNSIFVQYHKHYSTKPHAPTIIFHHGFMSDMNGSKALYLQEFCQQRDYNFIRFDNLGCGQSSGIFHEQNISSWVYAANQVLLKLAHNPEDTHLHGPVILVGSSAGAWVAALSALQNSSLVQGLVTIAAAFDFTEDLLWAKLAPADKEHLIENGTIMFQGDDPACRDSYPVSYQLIEDGRKYFLLRSKIALTCPVHLIHGVQDHEVPYATSLKAMELIAHDEVAMKLINNAGHSLSRPQDLHMIGNSIEEQLKLIMQV